MTPARAALLRGGLFQVVEQVANSTIGIDRFGNEVVHAGGQAAFLVSAKALAVMATMGVRS